MEKLIVIILCLPVFCNGQASDQTLQPHASGEDVVDATIGKIRSKCILVEDKYLMRRIAAVETDFGKNSAPNTGGIWAITNSMLMAIKTNCQYRLRTVCNDVVRDFSFDVTKATMSQMDVPLYSALVMQGYLSILAVIGRRIPATKSDQADFWIRYIRPTGNKKDFIEKAATKISYSTVQMELVIAIDASGSVGGTNFRRTLNFLQSVVKDLQISPNMTRVGVIRFATRSTVSFNLDTYSTSSGVIKGISNIAYTGGGTATDVAIDLARNAVFVKARPNVPKVFVLITDGQSNSMPNTIAAANRLKTDTTIFTIGIGRVNRYEMLAIASVPQCSHYFALYSYNEIHAIINEIQRESCDAPVSVKINVAGVKDPVIDDNPIPSNNETKVQNLAVKPDDRPTNKSNPQNTIDIKVDVICGTVNIYAHNQYTPSSSIYTYKAVATDNNPGWIHSPTSKKLYLSLVSQKRLDLALSACSRPHYNISFNPPEEGVSIICRENGKERKCTSDDIKLSFGSLCDDDDNVPNPCTKTNILNNKLRFKHPKSSNKYIQCKLTGQMEIVNCPKGTQYDESQSVCGPQITGLPPKTGIYKGANPCTKQAIMNRQFYFANPADKSTFIQCNEWGTAFLVHCSKNTVWSQQAYTCVHHSKSISLTNNPCKSSNNPSFYHENPGNRRSFIQCDNNGNAFTLPCPLGTVWLQAKLTCVHDSVKLGLTMSPILWYTSTAPPTTTTIPTKCTYGEYLPHKDPHKYYVCEWNGGLTEMSCPGGLVWIQASKVCNWPSGSA